MPRPPPQSFLLRLWREQAGAPLFVTLVPVARPGEHQHFADMEALCNFLRAQDDPPPEEHRIHQNCTRSETD